LGMALPSQWMTHSPGGAGCATGKAAVWVMQA
jgi:hypothetical protein